MTKKKIHIFHAPLYVLLGKDPKHWILNLNNYRNWHYRTSNSIKIKFKELMKDQLFGTYIDTPVKLTFIYFKGRNGKSDRANVLSIHEKFFCDALVEYGCIPDDNDNHIKQTTYLSGGLDKANPRVEIHVEEL